MNRIKIISPFLIAMLLVSACRKDFTMPQATVVAPTGNVSFDSVVLPILVTNCAKANCHASGAHAPELTTTGAYAQLTGLGYVPQDDTSETGAKNSILYKMITSTSKPMPPTSPLTGTQIGQILAWIKQGAQQN
jgi:hypothetical protein